jgi:hypothetical protein
MVSSVHGVHSSNILSGIPSQPTTPSGSTDSFTKQLEAALEGYLAQSGKNSHLQIDIQATQSQDSGTRQFVVTVKDPDSAPAETTAAATSPAPAAAAPTTDAAPSTDVLMTGFVSVPRAIPTAGNSSVTPSANAAAGSDPSPAVSPLDEVNAYWAAQPLAVQQLRNMDPAPRALLAQQLADQGYTIDNTIMVWGWDPKITMEGREQCGYTWVPSYNQPNASTPGLAVGKQAAYDPKSPPPGSIAVNMDFMHKPAVTNTSS